MTWTTGGEAARICVKMLGDNRYESFAAAGQAMSNAAMAAYAFEQIDRTRAALSSPTAQT
ncbi:hypothetical protein QGN32_01615 [Mycolicibacterium sp. ND9-15]|uniref:hypothetical protein n=1 Tax=Mycolicibacterium sp. ND9-15 TaxID=3042320 RepID=UPI002DD9D486|nr:hypothetical protein [Mycolicibacterium sp. ND9-15]WSE56663.1 hypothetical protein QGN32_01615 [Mycolicibacterium sp. ND9-15]